MKNRILHSARYISAGLCLLFTLLANQAGAITYFWDPEGVWAAIPPAYTGVMTGNWEDTKWSTVAGGQASGVAWQDALLVADFAVGAGLGTPPFTLTMNSNHTLGGIIDGTGATPNACNVTINGPGVLTLGAGTIARIFDVGNSVNDGSLGVVTINNVIAGIGAGLTVRGNGQIALHAANTYAGPTLLGNAASAFTGILNFNNVGAFSTGSIVISNTSVSGFGTLALEGASALTITNTVTFAGSTNNSVNLVGNVAGLTFSGPWSFPFGANVGSGVAGSPVTISSVMSGTGGMNKFNPGPLNLTALNTYTGNTSVSNGVLQLGDGASLNGTVGGTIGVWSPGSLVFANPTALTFSKVISGSGPVTCQGAGILTLSAANTYAGATTISAASTVQQGVANAIPSGLGRGDVSLAGKLNLASLACSVNGLNGSGSVDSLTGAGTTLTAGNNGANSTFSGIIKNTTGTVSLTKAGTGTLTLSGPNTYAGATIVSGGTLQLGVDNAIPVNSVVSVSAGATLDMNGHSDTITNLYSPGNVINNNSTLTVNANAGAFGSPNFNGYSCLAGVLGGSGSLVKSGTHTMSVRGDASGFAGAITLAGGTFSVGAAPNRLPTSLALAVPAGVTFQLDANNQTVSSLTGSGNINLCGGVLTINQAGSAAFNGPIRNSDLGGAPTVGHGLRGYYYANIDFTGLTTVRDDSTVNLDMTGIPNYAASTKTNQISVRWLGQVLTTVAGSYVFTTTCDDGSRLWVNGTLLVDNWVLQGATANRGTNTLAANTRYDIVLEYFNNAGPGSAQLSWTPPGDTVSSVIPNSNLLLPGPGSLVKTGGGTQQLSGPSAYSGGTTVSNGTLEATANGALGSGNVTVAAGAHLQLDSPTAMNAGADLILASTANVNLNFSGQSNIRAISLDGGATYGSAGTYGAAGSGAANTSPIFTGVNGVLNVTAETSFNQLTSSPTSPATVVYGTPVSLSALIFGLGPTPSGTVTFYDGALVLGTSTLVGSTATLTVSNLQVATSPHSLTAVYNGDAGNSKSTSTPVTVAITRATITPVPVIASKVYDTTTTATITNANFGGILPSDTNNVNITGPGYTATFTDRFVGTNKTVTITGLVLGGSLSGNYVLSATSVSSTGNITARPINISGLTANSRVYDGNTDASVTGAAVLNGVLTGDTVTLSGSPVAAFTTRNAGPAKPVTLTNSSYTLGGASAANYSIAYTNISANITAFPVSVDGMSVVNKVYDGTTTATLQGSLTTSPTFFSGDAVSIVGTPVAYFSSALPGTWSVTVSGYTLAGADATSYSLSQPQGLGGIINPIGTTATLVSSLNPSTNGNSVTFTFKVTPTALTNNPTGSVTFYTNNIAVSPTVALVSGGVGNNSSTAVFTTALLPIGTTPVTCVYGGDAIFSAPAIPTVNQVVQGTGVCSQTNRVLSVTANVGNTFTVNLIGTYQAQYRIVSQTNAGQPMINWVPVLGGTNTVSNPSGLWSVTVSNHAPAFFRSQAMSGVCP
jgi:fibronectin-binding autotransporter adhesin